MSKTNEKYVILACTGMGKILASVGRSAEFLAHEKFPDTMIVGNFPGIAAGLENDIALLKRSKIITLTGCTERCPQKIFTRLKIPLWKDLEIWEIFKKNKTLKPEIRRDIGKKGLKLAEKIVDKIMGLLKE